MKRLMVLGTVAAMVLVLAVPAFADTTTGGSGGCDEFGFCGGGGGRTETSGDWYDPSGCDPYIQSCSGTLTTSGGSGGGGQPGQGFANGGSGGRYNDTVTTDITDPANPLFEHSGSIQGGNSADGGGNCTFEGSNTSPYTADGSGPRCENLFE